MVLLLFTTDNSLPVLLSSWNYGDKYAKYQSETISLKKSQICLLLQQKYNKTVQVQVTIIPRQPGKELSVSITGNEIQEVIDETMEMRLPHRDTEAPVTTFQHVFRSEQYLVNGTGLPANSDYRFDPVNDQQRFYDDPVFEQFPNISTQDYDVRTDGIYRQQ